MVIGEGAGDADGVGQVGGDVGGGVTRRVSCQYCGMAVTVRNMARHLRQRPVLQGVGPRGVGGNCGQR